MTLTGLPRPRANPELHHYEEKYKKWKSFRKHGFHLITVWLFQTKNSKLSRLTLENKTKEPQNLKGNNWRWTLQPGTKKLVFFCKLSIFFERGIPVKTVETFARLQLVNSWNDHLFCQLAWPWQVQWHYQCRHVQAQTPVSCSSPTLLRKYALKAS